MPRHPDWAEDLYDFLADEEEGRTCKAIGDDACKEVPGNFLRIFLANTLTKIGDRISNPKTTIAWLLQAVGAPALFTGLVVPIRESGSLIPQVFISGFVRSLPVRKGVWVAGAFVQGAAIAGIGLTALTLSGAAAGWAVTGLLVLFSIARGFCSITSKDVLGKTIPKTRRGRLSGLMSAASGFLALVGGALLWLPGISDGDGSTLTYAVFLFAAAGLWFIAGLAYGTIVEFAGEHESGAGDLRELLGQFALLRDDGPFRNFVIVRALAMGSGLATPFVIALAHRDLGGAAGWLGLFIVVDGLAAMLAAPAWGKWADRSSRAVLGGAMLLAAAILAGTVLAERTGLAAEGARWFYPLAIFLLGVVHAGVRLGRKTYVVDMAGGNKRTDYVAVGNTTIGLLLLVAGTGTGILALSSPVAAISAFAAAAVGGAALSRRLPDVSG